jgi:DUF2959 family protein
MDREVLEMSEHSVISRMFIALFFLAAAVGGCKTTTHQRAEIASRRIGDTQAEAVKAKARITESVSALDDLIKNPQPNIAPQYEKFSDAVDDLEAIVQRTRDRISDMRVKREAYLASWQKEAEAIQDPEMQKRALIRIEEAKADFSKLNVLGEQVKTSFAPFLASFKDLQRYIGSDLTPGGIKSVVDLADKARQGEPPLQKSLDDLIGELDRVKGAFSSTVPPPAAPPPSAPLPAVPPAPPPAAPPAPPPAAAGQPPAK